MNVLLIDESLSSSDVLRRAVVNDGNRVVSNNDVSWLIAGRIKLVDVELIIVNVEAVSFDMMKALRQIVQHHALPIVIFAQREGVVRSSDVVKLGICAYIIDGLSVERIKPILEVAQARFEQFRLLQDEILASKQALSERKDIERAKGILMRQRNFSEDEAYNTLRKTAMSQNKRLADVARSIISVADMFG